MDITQIAGNVEVVEVKVLPMTDGYGEDGYDRGTRVYFTPQDYGVHDDFVRRVLGVEPWEAMEAVDKALLPAALERAGLPVDQQSHWSRLGGCECGCSPAIVLWQSRDVDVFVTYRVLHEVRSA